LPHIAGYSTLAATAGAIPIPWLDLLILPGIQTRMIYHLAQLYGQPLTGARFVEYRSIEIIRSVVANPATNTPNKSIGINEANSTIVTNFEKPTTIAEADSKHSRSCGETRFIRP